MKTVTERYMIIFIVLCLVGTAFSFVLVREHYYGPIVRDSGYKAGVIDEFAGSVCGSGKSIINCGKVARSKYSKVGGIPLAQLGLSYFIFLGLCAGLLLLAAEQLRRALLLLLFWLTAAGAFWDVVLLLVSILRIKALCTLCLVTYGCLWGGLALLWVLLGKRGERPFEVFARTRSLAAGLLQTQPGLFARPVVIVGGGFLLAMLIGFAVQGAVKVRSEAFAGEARRLTINEIIRDFMRQRRIDIDTGKIGPLLVLGKENAPVTIVEFSDFLCPSCANVSSMIDEVLRDNYEKVRLVFVNFPLDMGCNALLERQVHEGACDVAKGAICAGQQGKFREYYHAAFGSAKQSPGKVDLVFLAETAGLDIPLFQGCVANPRTGQQLSEQVSLGQQLGVNSTPSFFINNRKFENRPDKDLLDALIEHHLKIRDINVILQKTGLRSR